MRIDEDAPTEEDPAFKEGHHRSANGMLAYIERPSDLRLRGVGLQNSGEEYPSLYVSKVHKPPGTLETAAIKRLACEV